MKKVVAMLALSMSVATVACQNNPDGAIELDQTHIGTTDCDLQMSSNTTKPDDDMDQMGECRWAGTAPICDGDCGGGLELDRAADPDTARVVAARHQDRCGNWQSLDFGETCAWGGWKVLCWFVAY